MISLHNLLKTFLLAVLFFQYSIAQNKPFTFAHITDTHIGSENAAEDLEMSVKDINNNSDIEFVIHTGDVTEFGSDEELYTAKKILDKLKKPYYIVPGNHDAKWSESGCNTFLKVFKSECFAVEKNGFLFIGLASGPNMRMSPGQIPREHLEFLQNELKKNQARKLPLISVNHYPLDSGLNNWYEVIDQLKKQNIQAHLMGHGHSNKVYNFEGIPAVMGRSNLRADKTKEPKDQIAAYNIVRVENNKMIYSERKAGKETSAPWATIELKDHSFSKDTAIYKRPDYSINLKYPNVQVVWTTQFSSDIGSGVVLSGSIAVTANTKGEITALKADTGKKLWTYKTKGKIFSTPAINNNIVIVGSSDNSIYGLKLATGKKIWKFTTKKSVLGSPAIENDNVFIGGSDGIFRALNYKTGKLIWQYNDVSNFVECRPLVFQENVYFGSWGNSFYALNKNTGKLVWRSEKSGSRMLSPAAVFPVGSFNKVFIVAPDRFMTAFDSKSGKEIYRSKEVSCRESIGISKDGMIIYIKSMSDGSLTAIDAQSETQKILWNVDTELGYEIAPSPITESGNLVFVPGQNGLICAVNKDSQKVEWRYKVSNTLINAVTPFGTDKILISTMDGKVICLKY
ncbi:PQQ-binding-like beta-propeller repeat protein [Flavobacterium sp. KJJ]|uniref:outer membrane protein assembly factor BamB family protein n=1 Tax=Flavobacterium sp. KJJ TaxID=1270193 RepID=UPI0004930345|nr:PQQ-binding-like beta-propeller repeat protein [Flavobacterium sp. KJJ]